MRCQGKKILITGASSGIGRACAEQFAQEGADLILCGRDEPRLQKILNQVTSQYYIKGLPLAFDISQAEEVEKALKTLPNEWRDIDVLVNNAGLALGYDKLYSGNVQEWDRVIDTNIKSVVYMTRFVVADMVKKGKGQVVNIGSISSRTTYTGGSVYCASKYAVRALTDTLRADLHGTGIRVTLVDPGLVKTSFFDTRLQGDQQKVDEIFAGMQALLPEDVADSVVYCVTRPPHVSIHEINIMPTDQTAAHLIHRRKKDE
jgi:3-hydroxy acid dehydrogenase/malonic semialdehyde reductase